MSKTKLKNAPLKEVIFEVHWNGSVDSFGIENDSEFDLAQGRFAEKIKTDFPVHKRLIPENAPFKIYGSPLHQYWRGEFKWPVVQHGQSILAINEIEEGYEWETAFNPLVIDVLDKLNSSYNSELVFNKINLQYIDAWDLEDGDNLNFVKDNLQTELINRYPIPGELKDFNINQNFSVFDNSTLNVSITSGTNNDNGKRSIILTTNVEHNGHVGLAYIYNWVNDAHTISSDMFKKMLNPNFYANLDK